MFQVKDKPIHPDYYKYPSTDGEPMAETTRHFRWIVKVKENLETLTKGQDVFVAADLLWYPVQGQSNICKAPDVMVVLGRPKKDRWSYLQWLENNMPPQVVFEIFSKSNRRRENKENLLEFYQKYGVKEYYSYDPDSNTFVIHLLSGGKITRLEDVAKWESPLLQIRFEWTEAGFEIYHPDDKPFVNFEELETQNRYLTSQYEAERKLRIAERKRLYQVEKEAIAETQRADTEMQRADAEMQRADAEMQRADTEMQRADTEMQRADAEMQRAKTEAQRADAAENSRLMLAEKLRQLGIDPDAL